MKTTFCIVRTLFFKPRDALMDVEGHYVLSL